MSWAPPLPLSGGFHDDHFGPVPPFPPLMASTTAITIAVKPIPTSVAVAARNLCEWGVGTPVASRPRPIPKTRGTAVWRSPRRSS